MKKIIVLLLSFLGLLLIGSGVLLKYLESPISTNTTEVSVVIPKGSGSTRIGNILKEKNLIRTPYIYRLIVWRESLAGKTQAGSYMLKQSMSVKEIANALTKGTADVWVTLPEGWRNEEVADELSQTFSEDFFDKQEFLTLTKNMQGKLFPDTYLLPKESSASTIAKLLSQTFEKKITAKMREDISSQGRTLDEVLVLASLVQREAKHAEDMNMIAGIMMNRLDIDMPLQIDATLQYVKGYDKNKKTWWPTPYAIDKTIKSPYNTYQNAGLPPSPIANPGIVAITAAIYPEKSEYFFYITDDNGLMHYAKTVEEHNANVQKYLR